MNIDIVKKQIDKLKNKKLKIKINIGRNKYEYLEGCIKDIYPNLFTMETNNGMKSFTFSDIITKTVILSEF